MTVMDYEIWGTYGKSEIQELQKISMFVQLKRYERHTAPSQEITARGTLLVKSTANALLLVKISPLRKCFIIS